MLYLGTWHGSRMRTLWRGLLCCAVGFVAMTIPDSFAYRDNSAAGELPSVEVHLETLDSLRPAGEPFEVKEKPKRKKAKPRSKPKAPVAKANDAPPATEVTAEQKPAEEPKTEAKTEEKPAELPVESTIEELPRVVRGGASDQAGEVPPAPETEPLPPVEETPQQEPSKAKVVKKEVTPEAPPIDGLPPLPADEKSPKTDNKAKDKKGKDAKQEAVKSEEPPPIDAPPSDGLPPLPDDGSGLPPTQAEAVQSAKEPALNKPKAEEVLPNVSGLPDWKDKPATGGSTGPVGTEVEPHADPLALPSVDTPAIPAEHSIPAPPSLPDVGGELPPPPAEEGGSPKAAQGKTGLPPVDEVPEEKGGLFPSLGKRVREFVTGSPKESSKAMPGENGKVEEDPLAGLPPPPSKASADKPPTDLPDPSLLGAEEKPPAAGEAPPVDSAPPPGDAGLVQAPGASQSPPQDQLPPTDIPMEALPPLPKPGEDAGLKPSSKEPPVTLPPVDVSAQPDAAQPPAEQPAEQKPELAVPDIAPPESQPAAEPQAAVPELPAGQHIVTLNYAPTEVEVPLNDQKKLEELANQIKHTNRKVKILGYASASAEKSSLARQVSLQRALRVSSFLTDYGVAGDHITVQPQGNNAGSSNPERVDVVVE